MEVTNSLHPLFKKFLQQKHQNMLVYIINHPAFYANKTEVQLAKTIYYAGMYLDLKELADYLDINIDDITNVEYQLRQLRAIINNPAVNPKVLQLIRSTETTNRLKTAKAVETISTNELCRRVTQTVAKLKAVKSEENVQLSIISNINRSEYITNSSFQELISRKLSTRALVSATTRDNFIHYLKQTMPLTYQEAPAAVDLIVASVFQN